MRSCSGKPLRPREPAVNAVQKDTWGKVLPTMLRSKMEMLPLPVRKEPAMSRRQRKGLSLIEVLVVIVIGVIVIGLFLPVTRRVREPAARAQCTNNIKQLMIAMHSYADTGRPVPNSTSANARLEPFFPAGCVGGGAVTEERLSWMVSLLPHLEHGEEYRQFDLPKGFAGNQSVADTPIKLFQCGQGGNRMTEPVTHYVAMSGIGLDAASRPAGAEGNGMMGYDRVTTMAQITDGASNTIAVLETRSGLGPWARGGTSTVRGYDPADQPFFGEKRPFGGHQSGMLAGFADGHVQSISQSTDPKVLAHGITIAGGEPITWD